MKAAFFAFLTLSFLHAFTQKQPPVKEGFISAGRFRVYYRQQGAGPAVIFLHAGLQNSAMWQSQVNVLSKAYCVVVLDLPFHGRTAGVDTSLLAAEAVKIIADSLGLQKPSLVGLSLGASVAQDFSIAYPQRVSKLVLMSAGINGYERQHTVDSVSLVWYAKYTQAMKAKDTAAAAKEFALAWGEGIRQRGELTKPVAQSVYLTTLQTIRTKPPGWPRLQTAPPAFDRIGNVRVPTLIIHGNEDLPYIGAACRYLEKMIPGARRVLLKGAAHMVNVEQPEKINKLLLDFLR